MYQHDTIVPYAKSESGKKEQVADMFNKIAGRYDFMNRFLSMRSDVRWRKKALRKLRDLNPQVMLDVATGTADVAIMAKKLLNPGKIVGIDISEGMLEIGREKVKKAGYQNVIMLETGDSETINYPNNTFDAITVAFGVRNFENLEKGLQEMLRVLKPGGRLVVLEFSKPKNKGWRKLYDFYMETWAPKMASLVSKNKEAYLYLNKSARAFPERKEFTDIMERVGFTGTSCQPLSLGICCIYCGNKES
jgi:demethylmenaquinone methyltransferase / 2-methoxy-6-polyprenyl-1,4-benzoquinol methylase